jgi:hypothetical protein
VPPGTVLYSQAHVCGGSGLWGETASIRTLPLLLLPPPLPDLKKLKGQARVGTSPGEAARPFLKKAPPLSAPPLSDSLTLAGHSVKP